MRTLFFLSILLIIFLSSCSENNSSGNDFKAPIGFQSKEITSNVTHVFKKNDQYVAEEGYLLNNKKHGFWITYFPNREKIKTIQHYINGVKWGAHKEFNINGKIQLHAEYKNGRLHGKYKRFDKSVLLEEATYDNGKMIGEQLLYFTDYKLAGKVQQKRNYKNGVLHGKYQYFNAEGEIVLEYEYVNGEKQE